jgi:hypothetical protein
LFGVKGLGLSLQGLGRLLEVLWAGLQQVLLGLQWLVVWWSLLQQATADQSLVQVPLWGLQQERQQ